LGQKGLEFIEKEKVDSIATVYHANGKSTLDDWAIGSGYRVLQSGDFSKGIMKAQPAALLKQGCIPLPVEK
jgi:hypothetical protein